MLRPVDRDAELEPDIAADRRRPGRQDDVNPSLVPLLRGTTDRELDDPDQLASARGILVWVFISAVLSVILLAWLWWG
jgi:hypothetical protein